MISPVCVIIYTSYKLVQMVQFFLAHSVFVPLSALRELSSHAC